jgi:hypothetical protein
VRAESEGASPLAWKLSGVRLAGSGYCTVREIVFAAEIVPELPVTVIV